MKRLSFLLSLMLCALLTQAQQVPTAPHYYHAFDELHAMLAGERPVSFKQAVYLTENAYLDGNIDYKAFDNEIQGLANLARFVAHYGQFDYPETDSSQVKKYWAAFIAMKQSLTIPFDSVTLQTTPFTYDFEDFFGEKDWSKMFVSKLLATHTGNCHSLPFLYKMVVEELGEEAWLSMAPNHTYIKQWTEKSGWFNTELTSGQFPVDAWIMASGYIKLEAIQNRLYMDTLSAQQSIAIVMTDLAQGYEKKYGTKGDPAFALAALDTALAYYPNYAHARLLKAEALKAQYERLMANRGAAYPSDLWHDPTAKALFDRMQEAYSSVYNLGYRQMPKEMYLNWLMDIDKQQTNKEVEKYTFTPPQPFKDYGYEVPVTTMTNGKYQEFFDLDTIAPIGTVLLNRRTGQITGFVTYDTLYSEASLEPQVISRWLNPDPMADAYYEHSPYSYVANNPIKYIDPDGNIIIDKDGNIVVTTTGEQRKSAVPVNRVSNSDGTFTDTYIQNTYEVVNIFADNGTPIEALRLVSSNQVNAQYDANGKLIDYNKTSVDNPEQFDCKADCHGLTFANNKLWINDEEVNKLLENDNIWRDVSEDAATGVVFTKNGAVVHSTVRNADGTYDDNAGILTTERGRSLGEASRGLTDSSNKKNREFILHMGNTILNTNLGTVKDGVRKITDEEEIRRLINQINNR